MRALTAMALAALMAVTFAAAPAQAFPIFYPPHHGFWGPGLVLGLGAAAIAGGFAYDDCVRYRPIYDQWGNYIGRRLVNVC